MIWIQWSNTSRISKSITTLYLHNHWKPRPFRAGRRSYRQKQGGDTRAELSERGVRAFGYKVLPDTYRDKKLYPDGTWTREYSDGPWNSIGYHPVGIMMYQDARFFDPTVNVKWSSEPRALLRFGTQSELKKLEGDISLWDYLGQLREEGFILATDGNRPDNDFDYFLTPTFLPSYHLECLVLTNFETVTAVGVNQVQREQEATSIHYPNQIVSVGIPIEEAVRRLVEHQHNKKNYSHFRRLQTKMGETA